MIVADTSALLSIATGGVVELVLAEFEVHTTVTVVEELEATAEHDDAHADAAGTVLDHRERMTVNERDSGEFTSSRIDDGEGSCIALARDHDPAFVLTDDLRALPELQPLVGAEVAISPIVLKALVNKGVLEEADAEERLERIARTRSWLGAPIYRRARRLFE